MSKFKIGETVYLNKRKLRYVNIDYFDIKYTITKVEKGRYGFLYDVIPRTNCIWTEEVLLSEKEYLKNHRPQLLCKKI